MYTRHNVQIFLCQQTEAPLANVGDGDDIEEEVPVEPAHTCYLEEVRSVCSSSAILITTSFNHIGHNGGSRSNQERGSPRCFFWLLHRGLPPRRNAYSFRYVTSSRISRCGRRRPRSPFWHVVHLASPPWHVSCNVREIKYSIAPRAMQRSEDHSDRCKSCIYTRPERAFIRAFVLSHDVFPLWL